MISVRLLAVALVIAATSVLGCESGGPRAKGKPAAEASTRSGTPSAPQPEKPAGKRHDSTAAGLHYLTVTTGGAGAEDSLPMIVAIHGLGDSPPGFVGLFRDLQAKARVVVPRAPIEHGRGYSWFPFRLSGQSEEERAEVIGSAADQVAHALDELTGRYPTIGKPIVTGFSQGGMISFALAVTHPEKLSAAFPIGGLLPTPLRSKTNLGHSIPVVAFHGEADAVVPVEPTREAVRELSTHGVAVSIHTYPGVGHAVPPEMRQDLFQVLGAACRDATRGEVGP